MKQQKKSAQATQVEVVEASDRVLQLITPTQQRFIEAMLCGSSLSAAATSAGISRRCAYYWMNDPAHPVRKEYEKQLALLRQDTRARVSSIHTKALAALEDLLAPETPPFLRLGAVRMLFDSYLHELFTPQAALSPAALVRDSLEDHMEESHEQATNQIYLYDDRGRERIPEDE